MISNGIRGISHDSMGPVFAYLKVILYNNTILDMTKEVVCHL